MEEREVKSFVVTGHGRIVALGERQRGESRWPRRACGRAKTRLGHTPAGAHALRCSCPNRSSAGCLRCGLQGERAGRPPRISVTIRADQKARVRPLRIWGLRFSAKNAWKILQARK